MVRSECSQAWRRSSERGDESNHSWFVISAVFLAAAGLALVLGFVLANDFGGVVLAEVVGMLIGAELTPTLIAVFEEDREQQRWARVQTAVLRAPR